MMERYTQQELCNAIYYAVAWAEKPLSRREICDKIKRKKSPHILKMIEHLVETSFIGKCTGTDKHGKVLLLYFPPDKKPEGLPCECVQ